MTDHFLVPIGRFGPVTRSMLSEYAQASGDNNPLHLSDAAAQLAGHREVIAQGMLSMAFVGRWVTSWCPLDQIHSLSSRFTAPTPLGSHLICEGHVTCKEQESAKIVYTVTTETAAKPPDHGTHLSNDVAPIADRQPQTDQPQAPLAPSSQAYRPTTPRRVDSRDVIADRSQGEE